MGNAIFWLIVIAWLIGAGSITFEEYKDAREDGEGKRPALLAGAKLFFFWWVLAAWEVFKPRLVEWWESR